MSWLIALRAAPAQKFGFSSAAVCMCGIASRMALFSDWILPSVCIEPEQSQIQKNGEDEMLVHLLVSGSSDHPCVTFLYIIFRSP